MERITPSRRPRPIEAPRHTIWGAELTQITPAHVTDHEMPLAFTGDEGDMPTVASPTKEYSAVINAMLRSDGLDAADVKGLALQPKSKQHVRQEVGTPRRVPKVRNGHKDHLRDVTLEPILDDLHGSNMSWRPVAPRADDGQAVQMQNTDNFWRRYQREVAQIRKPAWNIGAEEAIAARKEIRSMQETARQKLKRLIGTRQHAAATSEACPSQDRFPVTSAEEMKRTLHEMRASRDKLAEVRKQLQGLVEQKHEDPMKNAFRDLLIRKNSALAFATE